MHEDYSYNDDDEHDYDDVPKNYKYYFKFDPAAWDVWGKWLYDALNEIVDSSPNTWYTMPDVYGFPYKSVPVNSYFSNTGKGDTFQYLGNNYQGSPIWKKKYFVLDPIDIGYKNHIQSHAVHFINQPHYYKGMFDILN